MKLAFLTTHLTGTGHLVRILALAAAGRDAGHQVLVLSGGRPLPHIDTGGVEVVQLPPLGVRDLDYKTLRKECGAPADADYMAERSARIAEELRRFAPDFLITETFPLGRRALAAEFEAAIDTTDARAVASVRDIPEPKPRRLAEAETRLKRHYTALLVHGDADFLPLSASWPLRGMEHLIHHTGYVARAEPVTPIPGDVVVSVGGGDLGGQLLSIAAESALTSDRDWHLLAGSPPADLPSAPNLRVEPPRSDYRGLLAGAQISVSLCGYNTAVDLAQADTPAILVPMTEGRELEQLFRARALARFEGFKHLRGTDLTADRLNTCIEALAGKRRKPLSLVMDGARTSIEILGRL
ncbi:MAG: glycosyltransferase [Pseudomonadota bacterium]